jgi:hypothetical protein
MSLSAFIATSEATTATLATVAVPAASSGGNGAKLTRAQDSPSVPLAALMSAEKPDGEECGR